MRLNTRRSASVFLLHFSILPALFLNVITLRPLPRINKIKPEKTAFPLKVVLANSALLDVGVSIFFIV